MTDKSNGPDLSNLAHMLLDWEVLERKRIELEGAICDTVMQVGETVKVGYVVASYSGGVRKFDYANAGLNAPHEIILAHTVTTTSTTTDWRAVCEHAGIEKNEIPCSKSDPSVSLRLLK